MPGHKRASFASRWGSAVGSAQVDQGRRESHPPEDMLSKITLTPPMNILFIMHYNAFSNALWAMHNAL